MFDFYPEKIYSRVEVMGKPSSVPPVNGVYFWWFKEIPPGVPTDGCITYDAYTLLYVGISPDQRGKPKESANKQVMSSQADSLIKISRIWADFFPANTSNQPI